MNKKISICIPVHNAHEHVAKLLECLQNTESNQCEQVFVDDASNAETRSLLIRYCARNSNASYLRNYEQQLFTRTLNRAIRAASPDTYYYCCLNTDCELKEGWLDDLVQCMERHPEAGIVGYPDGRVEDGEDEPAYYPEVPGRTTYITGHCFIVKKEVFDKVGLLCETDLSQAHISSERMLCYKAAEMGYEMWYIHSDKCHHSSGGASWKRDLTWLYNFPLYQLWQPGRNTW